MTEDNERRVFNEWWRNHAPLSRSPYEHAEAAWLARSRLAPKGEPVASARPSPERAFLRAVATWVRSFRDISINSAATKYLEETT